MNPTALGPITLLDFPSATTDLRRTTRNLNLKFAAQKRGARREARRLVKRGEKGGWSSGGRGKRLKKERRKLSPRSSGDGEGGGGVKGAGTPT